MKILIVAAAAVLLMAACQNTRPANEQKKRPANTLYLPKLEEVFADSTYQLTGVAISANGRLFTNYPYWLDTHNYSVIEVVNGKPVPYPDREWNSFKKGENGQNKFVCVQSVVTDNKGYLWVVDAAGIGLSAVYQKSNKVIKINLANNKIERVYRFPDNVAGADVYLNDIRIDNKDGFAYMTSSSGGGIVILNLNTGASRFVLGNHPSVKSDTAYRFSPTGTELVKGDGKAIKVNSDGIALTPDNKWLYYKPLTDNRLFRVSTALLRNFNTPQKEIADSVKDLGHCVTTDGMIFDKSGNLYLGDLEKSSIVKITPDLKMHTIVTDKAKLRWPDSYSISRDGYLYISTSQIQYMPWFHKGEDKIQRPFKIYRIKL
ncbi:SMP-30/gluconolactonase/LRE family protein [Mucilaginibacter sp. Bleaf8]|uniref:L-dopachrome tautomerase-related protein n=1 Tax=Mucilaginibacter sp. Bleaf8 TaxID=2834430 RepID=UPI001BCE54DE|nr:L-dopachrome tautomerase-related protein [Mucilaginibacter sp. Bleaf8]MBS7566959.1 SMP-30/gluconolactonase/LRE family protein [Mucilaginibacter sp. Bleaf8]